MDSSSDIGRKIYDDVFGSIPAKPIADESIPEGFVRCTRCGGTGVGAPGEKYYEMGTGTYGCSECHGFGYNPTS